MALSSALQEILYRLKNLSNNRHRESDIAAAINQINLAIKSIALELDSLVVSGGGVSDHSQLSGRESADQHPISSIAGLASALSEKQASDQDLTLIAALTGAGVLQRKSDNTWELITGVQRIHVGASAPADTTMLWVDTN